MKNSINKCALCGLGNWIPHNDGIYKFRHGRKTFEVENQHYAICDHCETRGYLPDQRSKNRKTISSFQEALDGFISPSDVLAVREKYCLSQLDAAKIFGGGTQGFSKWERGTTAPAGPTARLLRLALNVPAAMEYLASNAGIALDLDKLDTTTLAGKVIAMYTTRSKESFSERTQDDLNLTTTEKYEYEQ